MKKKFIITAILAIMLTFAGCGNQQFMDTTYTFNYAQIKMMDGTVIEGKVDSWKDFDNSDQIQVKINGNTYLTYSSNVVLINRKG